MASKADYHFQDLLTCLDDDADIAANFRGELTVVMDEQGVASDLKSRDASGPRLWQQDLWLAEAAVRSKVGGITVSAKSGSKTGLSHINDWAIALDLMSTTGQVSPIARLLVKFGGQVDGASWLTNPYALGTERLVLGYALLISDFDIFSRFARQLAQLRQPVRKGGFTGGAERATAREWIVGGRPLLRELKNCSGISSRIDDDARATEVLSSILRVFAAERFRVVLLVDEFQRIGSASTKQREGLLASLRSLFSRNPTYFSAVLAVASRIERTALDLLPPELRAILGVQPVISLPEMSEAEAIDFVMARFASFRPPGYSARPADPFSDDVIRASIATIPKLLGGRLIPRHILQTLALLYDDYMETGAVLTPVRVEQILGDLRFAEDA